MLTVPFHCKLTMTDRTFCSVDVFLGHLGGVSLTVSLKMHIVRAYEEIQFSVLKEEIPMQPLSQSYSGFLTIQRLSSFINTALLLHAGETCNNPLSSS